LKNLLAALLGFFLVFGIIGKCYADLTCSESCVYTTIGYNAPQVWNQIAYNVSGFDKTCDLLSAVSPTANISQTYYVVAIAKFYRLSTGSWFPFSSRTALIITSSALSSLLSSADLAVLNNGQIVSPPVGAACPAPDCVAGTESGDYSIPGKDLSFNYCFNDCSLDSSAVGYDSVANVTFFHGSLNGQPCSGGVSSTPVIPAPPVVPTCPDGQIWSPSDSACVPISSGTGSAAPSTATTFPDSTPTYAPGETGYGTPTLPGAPSPVTGPQTTISGERATTTTTVNPDGSVTEETQKEETETPLDAPDGQFESYGKPSKTINFQNFNASLNGFAQGGPVRLFSDIIGVVQSLVATPAAPVFRLPVYNSEFIVDLSIFDPIALICRVGLSILALVSLAFFILKQWRAG
jgi:hypothetical protein